MKKVLILILCLVCMVARAEPVRVVTTLRDLADFAQQVGGDHVEVFAMASGEENPHNVMMTPSMITKLSQADLYIQMGLDMEHAYAPAVLGESRNSKIQYGKPGFMDMSKLVRVREVPKSLDRTEGDVHPNGNPHFNMDPAYARLMVSAIAEKLSELDPADKAAFAANAKKYNGELDAKIKVWKAELAGKKTKFVSYHPVWAYFDEFFGTEQVTTIEPKPGVEPGPRRIEEVIETMKSNNVKLVIKESYYSDRVAEEIAQKTGARVVSVPIMVGGSPEATDYIKMMDQVVDSFAGKS